MTNPIDRELTPEQQEQFQYWMDLCPSCLWTRKEREEIEADYKKHKHDTTTQS